MKIVEARVHGLVFDPKTQQHVVVLRELDGTRVLPIWIGPGEAMAIQLVNEAADRYFVGNAQLLRRLMTVERALQDNSKVVVPEDFDTTVKAPEPPQLPAGHPSVPSDKQ